tara:strand:+ start:624 stop:2477 length:1854 start_codon:yes stop_codon:yes gene_type:complete
MSKYILGLSCFYHDSAATLLKDGEIVAAVQEERFSRKKHDAGFPFDSVNYCLRSQNITFHDIEQVVYYEKPLLTFERLLETYLGAAPRGARSFIVAMQVWLKEKLFLKKLIIDNLKKVQKSLNTETFEMPKLFFSEHHLSHAASAYYPSPFNKSVILCMDGVGEWATTSAWVGQGNQIKPLWEISFPHSIGLLYSAFTYYCGFKVNSGEYKLMGLAPYGEPTYVDLIKEHLIDIKDDGTYRLNIDYFKYHRGFRMTSNKFHKLFGSPPRKRETKLNCFHMNLAASIQVVTEEIVLKLAKSLRKETGIKNICLSGGVALNCVANGKLLKSKIFDEMWIQPASGDAGSSLGAALVGWHLNGKHPREISSNDSMKGTYLGPEFSNQEIINYLDGIKATYFSLKDQELFERIAKYIAKGNVVGWFNGAMEFGPRALGGRSIIGDPRNQKMQSTMNLKIKYRESFRPFAPSVLEEDVNSQFEMSSKSPYMLLVAPVKKELCIDMTNKEKNLFGIDKLNIPRSTLPAITHVDYSARVQTVNSRTNPRYYNLIKAFKNLTGCPLLVNTSFNVRGEPIVCSPEDAYRCFMRTEMDILVLQNQILLKEEQPKQYKDDKWDKIFELD